MIEFQAWPKIPRWNREVTITEKIDGTNACIIVAEDGEVAAQSRKRIITPESDNFGFARWVQDRAEALRDGLGPGHHFGEWYGSGIQRRYGLDHKRFALFNTGRWADEPLPDRVDVVPVLLEGNAHNLGSYIFDTLADLREHGSLAAPGFMEPEGIVIFHHAAQSVFKVLLEGDEIPKEVDQ